MNKPPWKTSFSTWRRKLTIQKNFVPPETSKQFKGFSTFQLIKFACTRNEILKIFRSHTVIFRICIFIIQRNLVINSIQVLNFLHGFLRILCKTFEKCTEKSQKVQFSSSLFYKMALEVFIWFKIIRIILEIFFLFSSSSFFELFTEKTSRKISLGNRHFFFCI